MLHASMAQRLAPPLLAAIALASGCDGVNTTTKDGPVGDTLNSGGLRVTVLKTARSVPRPANDVTGLTTPRPGMKFVGIKARVCTDRDQAIKAYDFQLDPADPHRGGQAATLFARASPSARTTTPSTSHAAAARPVGSCSRSRRATAPRR